MFRIPIVFALFSGLLAYASPTLQARNCSPNFQGQAQTIYVSSDASINVAEWTPDSIYPGAHITLQTQSLASTPALNEFLVQFTGQPDGSYVFRLQDETNRYTALTTDSSGGLTNELLDLSTSLPTQQFTISCLTCSVLATGATAAQGCVIQNPASGLCIVGSNAGDTLSMGACSLAGEGVYQFQGSV